MSILLLASQSESRAKLLEQSKIPFKIINQNADESACDWQLPIDQLAQSIALSKMKHTQLPIGKSGDQCFVLTADTVAQDKQGKNYGKPSTKIEAIAMINALRHGICCTAFCLDKKEWNDGDWKTTERIVKSVAAEYEFCVPVFWKERYLQEITFNQISGGIQIEGYGAQFLKMVNGSYSTILGLPMFEVREALEEINFF